MKKEKGTAPAKGPVRASLRIKLHESVEAARKCSDHEKRPRSLRIPRTVEMVDQESEDWRSEKSQLLFMTAMGLTPKADWKGNFPLSLNVEELSPKSKSSSTSTTETKDVVEADDYGIYIIQEHLPNQNFSPLRPTETNADVEVDDDCVLIIDDKLFPNKKSSSSGYTKSKAGVEVDDGCVCVGVFKHLPLDEFPRIKLFRYSDS